MFGFIKKAFFVGLTVLLYVNPLSTNQLSCISMNNQKCKVRPEIINVNSNEHFILLVLKQANPALVATISMIHTQKYV